MELKFNKIKGAPEQMRIEGLNVNVLQKALAYKANCLTFYDEDKKPEFQIKLGTASTLDNYSLTINEQDMTDNVVVVRVVSSNPEATMVRATAFISAICEEATKLAEAYDNANAKITTI